MNIVLKSRFLLSFCQLFLISFILFGTTKVLAQGNDDCLMCHEDREITGEKYGRTISMYVNKNILENSVHRSVACASCHNDVGEDFPHAEKLKIIDCGSCHKDANAKFMAGMHGQALIKGSKHAPSCKECHGMHDILSPQNPKSKTYKMNIPILCGKCHKEGSPVARIYDISEHNIVENYSQGIHGIGLFKKGLSVTATCNNCHGNHMVLPYTSPNSTVNPKNIAKTCMSCHTRIEEVHTKIIKGELWEKEPGAIPSCSECHPPHKVKVESDSVLVYNNKECLGCHSSDTISTMKNGEKISLTVSTEDFEGTVHNKIRCIKCHTEYNPKAKRPCENTEIKIVNCTNCHAETSQKYFESGHGTAYVQKKEDAPYCNDCHGTHKILTRFNDSSSVYRSRIPELCGKCHKKDGQANAHTDLAEVDAIVDYSLSVHGKGLIEKGLLVSAVCTDCHTTHHMLKATDERSSVYKKNIPETCAKCHEGIYHQYIASDHSIYNEDGEQEYPACNDCHTSHIISEVDKDKFMSEVTTQCSKCHEKLSESFKDTYHGKAYALGYYETARCSDCHGAHYVLKASNPNSSVGKNNKVATCAKCHKNANEEFANYIAHATHNDKVNYPALYYAFWIMTSLLIGVFVFFGLHTLLWLPRSLKMRKVKKAIHHSGDDRYVRRFNRKQRLTHLFVIISFILLAITGMMLKFAHMDWAKTLVQFLGGVHTAGVLHRIGAAITFCYFGFHLINLIMLKVQNKVPIGKFIFGKNSLMPNFGDIREFIQTIKWFVGLGPKPKYGRWTYWEKFDYMAVFWGVAVIGFSGLVLWFPTFFTKFLPGWLINVSQIVHSDEALLAAGFIFTIHFFNTHFRPEAFPMDTVIFTGHVPLAEFKEDRPAEYEELEKSGKLEEAIVRKTFSKRRMRTIRAFGFTALITGVILVIFIIFSLLMG